MATICNCVSRNFPATVFAMGILFLASSSWGAHELVCREQPGDLSRVTVTLDTSGSLQPLELVKKDGRPDSKAQNADPLPIKVTGRLLFDERIVEPAGPDSDASRSARFYHHAQASIKVAERGEDVKSRSDRRFIVAETDGNKATLWAPLGALSRDELDCLQVPASSLIVNRLLPTESVEIGDRWDHDADLVAQFFHFDAVERSRLSSKLIDVKNDLARMQITGTVRAIVNGAQTEMEVRGDCRFDMNWGRVTWLHLSIQEKREPGFVSPAYKMNAELKMRIAPNTDDSHLSDDRVDEMLASASPERRLLEYASPDDAYAMLHGRDWLITGVMPRSAAMRMVVEGELVAQCNIAQLPKLPPGKTLGLEDFQKEIQSVLGDRFKEFVTAKKQTRSDGYGVLRVVASGGVDKTPVQWIYYHLHDSAGNRAAIVYTMDEGNTPDFGASDMSFVSSFKFRGGAAIEKKLQQASAQRASRSVER